MTLRIYGIPASRAVRALWTAEELGLSYENVPIDYKDESDGPVGKARADFRAASPLGRIPAIDDDGFTLFESMAIDLYLARKHGGGLWPATLEGEALAFQWTLFAVTELEMAAIEWARAAILPPEPERDAARIAAAFAKLVRPLAVLDAALARRSWLAGDGFTVADLNVAATLFRLRVLPFADFPALAHWIAACFARPAAVRALALRGE